MKVSHRIGLFFAALPVFGLIFSSHTLQRGAAYSVKIARIKYNGGGDWYSSRTALKNLAGFCNKNIGTQIDPDEVHVELASADLFNYPYTFLTGHGNVLFSNADVDNLRLYLESGGFLHICDNYGMDKFIRREMKKVFPELDFTELPFTHSIYHQAYEFKTGLPKIHEHDGKAPKGYGLIYKGRLICFYDYECDLGNGWEDQEVYNDAPELRKKALQMGANIIQYTFNN